MTPIRNTPSGGMDKDTDLQYIGGGNYQDAHDVRTQDIAGNTGVAMANIKGNDVAITIPNITSSIKSYRIYVDTSEADLGGTVLPLSGKLKLVDSALPGGEFESATTTSFTIDPTTHYGNLVTLLQTLDNGFYNPDDPFAIGAFTTTGTYTGYFTISQNAIVDSDFSVLQTEGNLISKIELISEYRPSATDMTLKVIGLEQIHDYVFVLSVSNHEFSFGHVSEVGVLQYDDNTQVYTYTRLLRSNNLGFSPNYQAQIKGEVDQDRISLYWTDRHEKPRALYVPYPFVQDGCLTPNGGTYNYSTLDKETYLFLSAPTALLTIDSISDVGGNLSCGNKRYTGRFLTDSLVGTEFLYPTGAVNIYAKSTQTPYEIAGGQPEELTTKSVKMTLTGIPQDQFKYFELVAVEYTGDGFSAKIVQRYNIDGVESLDVYHTDLGQDNVAIGVNELVAVFAKYDTVGSIAMINNRMVLSNLQEQIDTDLEEWASSIEHELEQTTIPSVGVVGDLSKTYAEYRFGEYQDPLNTLNYTGYMFNDTYRFGIQVKWKTTGKWSKAYWIDDIRFDLSSTNVTTPNRRTANGIDINLTDDFYTETKVYNVKFGNIDLDYVVDGAPLHSKIEAYRIVRADRIPEVLSTGYFCAATSTGATRAPYTTPQAGYPPAGPGFDGSDVLFYYSVDGSFLGNNYTFKSGDTLKLVSGASGTASFVQKPGRSRSANNSVLDEWTGYFDVPASNPVYESVSVDAAVPIFRSGLVALTPSISVNNSTHHFHYAFKLPGTVYGTLGNAAQVFYDTAIYYGQVFRDLGNYAKYPANKELTIYNSTNHITVLFDGQVGIQTESVFGGDVFTQKTWFKVSADNYAATSTGNGRAYGVYSQNTVNTQMRTILAHDSTTYGPNYIYPQYTDKSAGITNAVGSQGAGLFAWLEQSPTQDNQYKYSTSYNLADGTLLETGYDVNSLYDGKRGSTIIYSPTKTVGSLKDNYRIYKPADIADLDPTQGDISFHAAINGSLYTWQEQSFRRQYFGESATMTGDNGSDVVVGAGVLFSVPSHELSSIGSDKKWAIVKGKNHNGKEVYYWFNDKLKKMVRFGGDGVQVISDFGMMSYLNNNVNFIYDKHEPITNRGINGVWNDRYSEAIFTFKGVSSQISEFDESGATSYVVGDMVVYSKATTHKSGIPFIYRNILATNGTPDSKRPGTGSSTDTYWEKLGPEDLPQYYTMMTLVWHETKNVFRSFHQYWPNIYGTHLNSFLTTDPLNTNILYLHDIGAPTTYYGTAASGDVTCVTNWEPNLTKQYEAVQFATDIVPYRVDYTTKNHTSFLVAADFTTREDFHYSPIKNNAVAGVVTGDSSRLFGRYMKTKLTMEGGVAQRLVNFIVKLRENSRLYNR